jgi:hypothetical protein
MCCLPDREAKSPTLESLRWFGSSRLGETQATMTLTDSMSLAADAGLRYVSGAR